MGLRSVSVSRDVIGDPKATINMYSILLVLQQTDIMIKFV